MKTVEKLSKGQNDQLLATLKERFEKNRHRHPDLEWEQVEKRLKENETARWSLEQMEATGGEPDVIKINELTGSLVFYDCSTESPFERRNLCYDEDALASRKKNKPVSSARGMAKEMGIELLDESEYRMLQEIMPVDLATSSWVLTPDKIRKLGGAVFGDCRFNTVFIYHNRAESYYASRGFRGKLEL